MNEEMELNYSDLLLTSHVLGELEEGEHLRVADHLSRDPQAVEDSKHTRLAAVQLQAELQSERMPRLTDLQRLAIEAKLNDLQDGRGPLAEHPPRRRIRRRWSRWMAAGIAAVVVLAVSLLGVTVARLHREASMTAGDIPQQLADSSADPAARDGDPNRPDGASLNVTPADWRGSASMAGRFDGLDAFAVPPRPVYEIGNSDERFRHSGRFPQSTFSLASNGPSYDVARRFLEGGKLPPADIVAVDQFINSFHYDLPRPSSEDHAPVAMHVEIGPCPWNTGHRLAKIGIAARQAAWLTDKPRNLVFLIDVSGSMVRPGKLPALKQALRQLVHELSDRDRIAMVVYSGNQGVVLASVTADRRGPIYQAIDRLESGGPVHDANGLELAYAILQRNFIHGGINRVILATDHDGDLGVGRETRDQLLAAYAAQDLSLSVLDFSTQPTVADNSALYRLTQSGGGRYFSVRNAPQTFAALVDQCDGKVETVAERATVAVAFNPEHVAAYRLIGYDRLSATPVDMPEPDDLSPHAYRIVSGQTITALYEIVPHGQASPLEGVDMISREPGQTYLAAAPPARERWNGATLRITLDLRLPPRAVGDMPRRDRFEQVAHDEGRNLYTVSDDFRTASAAAGLGMVLRDAPMRGDLTLAGLEQLIEPAGAETHPDRMQLLSTIRHARQIREQSNQ